MSTATAVAISPQTTQPAKTTNRSGPKTARGKAAAKLNAVRHGVFLKADVLPWESRKTFRSFVRKRLAYFAPEEDYEKELVEDIARLEWRMRRLDVFENSLVLRNAVSDIIDPELHYWRVPAQFEGDPEKLQEQFSFLLDVGKELEKEALAWESIAVGN